MSKLLTGSALSAFVLCVGAMAPGKAIAQTESAGEQDVGAGEGEIVVTAQRREQRLQDVPISVAVAGGELMRESQVTTLNDLSGRLSGVRINNAGASDSINIRGIGSGFNMGFEQSVATFVDGIYQSRSQASRGGFLDLERIEVLKGPQSTYFGSNAIAGALSITTRKPTETLEGYASALYSPSDGEFDVQSAVGGPLGGGFSGRVATRFSGMDGYTKNLRLDDKGPHNRDVQGRLALRYQTPGVLDINARVDYAKYDDQHSELQETINCPPGPGYGTTSPACAAILAAGEDGTIDYVTRTGDSSFELESFSGALTAAWTFGDHTLTSTTGYYEHDLFRTTVGGALLPTPALSFLPTGFPLTQPEKYHTFSQELRLQSDNDGLMNYVVGLYYDDSYLDAGISTGYYYSPFWTRVTPLGIIPANTMIAQIVYGRQEQSNKSVFAALTFDVSDAFRINLGGRYSSIHKEAHRSTRAGIGDPAGNVIQDFTPEQFTAWTTQLGRANGDYPITERSDDKFMPSVNVQYDITPDVMAYVSYTTGFKAGGWSIGQNFDIFEPEDVTAYEAGIKASWLGRRLTTNLTVFTSDYKNLQESTSIIDPNTGVNISIISNVGKARSRGIDFELGIHPGGGFNLSGNIGYLDAKYLVYPNAPCTLLQQVTRPTGCTQNLAGSVKAYAPRWSGSVNASYAADISSDLKIKLGGWLYFTSGFYQQASIDPLYYQPGYAKLDLRASLGRIDERWEVAVIGKNVTDKVTASYRAAMPASNAVSVRVDRPRSIAVQLSTKF